MSRGFIYYALIAVIFVALKSWYTTAGNEDLQLFLGPVSRITAMITNTSMIFNSETGYYFPALDIVIDRSCSGFNFWLICFVMIAVASVPYIKKHQHAVAGFAAILLLCYVLTCFVNTARILFALLLDRLFPAITPAQQRIVHEAEGVFIYLSFLIIIYLLFIYFIKRSKLLYAKPAQP